MHTPPANCPWHEHYPRLTGRHLKAPTLKLTLHLAAAPNKSWCVGASVCLCMCAEISNKSCTLHCSDSFPPRCSSCKSWCLFFFFFLKSHTPLPWDVPFPHASVFQPVCTFVTCEWVCEHMCTKKCISAERLRRHDIMTQLNAACHHAVHGRLSGMLLEPPSSGKHKNKDALPWG